MGFGAYTVVSARHVSEFLRLRGFWFSEKSGRTGGGASGWTEHGIDGSGDEGAGQADTTRVARLSVVAGVEMAVIVPALAWVRWRLDPLELAAYSGMADLLGRGSPPSGSWRNFTAEPGPMRALEKALWPSRAGKESSVLAVFMEWVGRTARLCHAVNRAYCQGCGDETGVSWEDASPAQRRSVEFGVRQAAATFLAGRALSPEQSHESWVAYKIMDGWHYGQVKDEKTKVHPCLVPWKDLPEEHRVKDMMFLAIVRASLETEVLADAHRPTQEAVTRPSYSESMRLNATTFRLEGYVEGAIPVLMEKTMGLSRAE